MKRVRRSETPSTGSADRSNVLVETRSGAGTSSRSKAIILEELMRLGNPDLDLDPDRV